MLDTPAVIKTFYHVSNIINNVSYFNPNSRLDLFIQTLTDFSKSKHQVVVTHICLSNICLSHICLSNITILNTDLSSICLSNIGLW